MTDKKLLGFCETFSLGWQRHDGDTSSPQIAASSILGKGIAFKLFIGLVDI